MSAVSGIDLGLDGKRALVTGAGAGAGRAIAIWLARAGCKVAAVDIDAATAEETVGSIRADGGTAIALTANVRVESEVVAMVERVVRELGGLDIAVNNVGMMAGRHARPFLEIEAEEFRDVVEQNLITAALCCRAEARAMIAQGQGGAIVNVSSGESQRPSPELSHYGAAKAAVNHLTRTLALELGAHGIRVNAMAPGTMLTGPVRAALNDAQVEALRQSIPLQRMTEPDDLARTALYLVSDLARDVTGQFVLADGGADLARARTGRSRG